MSEDVRRSLFSLTVRWCAGSLFSVATVLILIYRPMLAVAFVTFALVALVFTKIVSDLMWNDESTAETPRASAIKKR